jgi:AhpD family alkylhydroperoxidase
MRGYFAAAADGGDMMNRRWTLSLLSFSGLFWVALAHAEDQQRRAAPASEASATRAAIKKMLGFVPGFLNAMPDSALPGAWGELSGLQLNPNTALPPKIKELIGLAVSAQVPCKYCTYAHTEFAKLNGATRNEIGEAVVIASLTRHWSTVVHGFETDLAKFKTEITNTINYQKKAAGRPTATAAPVVDAPSARKDLQQAWGAIPEFMRRFPDEALPGAWKEMRDVQMSPNTELSGKHKSLIGIAVAAQIPCSFCLAADTEFAKLEGATEREIAEAVAMAAITRHWSTYLNGVQTDEAEFKRDIDRLVKGARKQMQKPMAMAPVGGSQR